MSIKSALILLSALFVLQAHADSYDCNPAAYCSGRTLKQSVKEALRKGIVVSLRTDGDSYFSQGPCEHLNLTTDFPVNRCMSGNYYLHALPIISDAVFKDKSVTCMPNPLPAFNYAFSSNRIPRYNPYTGKRRSLTISEFTDLTIEYLNGQCQQR